MAGLSEAARQARNAYYREYHAKNREKRNEYQRQYRKAHPLSEAERQARKWERRAKRIEEAQRKLEDSTP